METSLYRPTLRRAFQITTRHKSLWVLGFLAAFLGMGGEYEFTINRFTDFSQADWLMVADSLHYWPQTMRAFLGAVTSAFGGLSVGAYAAGLFFFGVIFLLGVLVIIAQGGLVKGLAMAHENKAVSLTDSLAAGWRAGWSLLAIIIWTRLLAFFVLIVVGAPLAVLILAINGSLMGGALSLMFFVLGVPLFIVFSLVAKYAVAYRMIEGSNFYESVMSGLRLFASHWLVSLEMALAVFVINILAALAFIIIVIMLASPFILFGFSLLVQLGSLWGINILFMLGLLVFLSLLLVLGSLISTFQNAAWTTLFMRIRDQRHEPKLLRILQSWR